MRGIWTTLSTLLWHNRNSLIFMFVNWLWVYCTLLWFHYFSYRHVIVWLNLGILFLILFKLTPILKVRHNVKIYFLVWNRVVEQISVSLTKFFCIGIFLSWCFCGCLPRTFARICKTDLYIIKSSFTQTNINIH